MPGFELIGEEEQRALQDIFSSSSGVLFAHGFDNQRNGIFRVRNFESDLSVRLAAKHCQAVTSGTAAQVVALKAMGVKPGDEVITQAFTFVATVEAILAVGAVPIVVDVDETLNMAPGAFAEAISEKTSCVVPVHMLGNPAEMDDICAIANENNLLIGEDACESLGASYKGVLTGTIGDTGFFSLDFGKTITSGEGGFILTNDPEIYFKMRSFHDHGHDYLEGIPRGLDTATDIGFNYRMTEMQAAVGIEQLKKLDYILSRNRSHKAFLKSGLADRDLAISFRRITDPQGELADTLMFFLEHEQTAAAVVKNLAEEGLGTKNVPDAMNWHFAANWGHIWKDTAYADCYQTKWSKSATILNRCVSLPIMVNWTEQDLHRILESITNAIIRAT